MIRSIITILFAAFLTVTSVAQKANVVSAYNYMKKGEMKKAWEYIEKARQHESTANDAKMWKYRGDILMMMAQNQDIEIRTMVKNAFEEGAKSYKKAVALDVKEKYTKQLKKMHIPRMRGQVFNNGIEAYNAEKYKEAYQIFYTVTIFADIIDVVDTLAYFNAALAADKANKPELAIPMYEKSAEAGYGGANTYVLLSEVYNKQENEDKYLETLQKGREKYPDDASLILNQLNYYLLKERFDEAKKYLTLAVEKEPTNEMLYFNQGVILERLKEYENARKSYEKAIELKPDYFDPYYNLGSMIYNEGVELNNQANELNFRTEMKKIESLQEKADGKFKESLPFFEKAHEINPEDKLLIQSLQQSYVRLKMTKKYQEMKDKLGQ